MKKAKEVVKKVMMRTRLVVVAMYINSVVALKGLLLSFVYSFSSVAHFSRPR